MRPIPELPPTGGAESQIVDYLTTTWQAWRQVRTPWLLQVEQNARALAGQTAAQYDNDLGQFVDLSEVFAPTDSRWRDQPKFNWLRQSWFSHSLAKLTENIVKLGALPAGPDYNASLTAALFDPFFSYQWNQMCMPEAMFRHYGWVLTAGESVLKLRWDPDKGDWWDFYGQSTVGVAPDDTPEAQNSYVDGMDEERVRIGDFACDVLCPTSVLTPYGPEPFHRKPWVMQEYLLDTQTVEERFGVEVQEDSIVQGDDSLLKMEYSSFYGNPGSPGGGLWGWQANAPSVVTQNQVRIYERWSRPTKREPQGRLIIVGGGKVLYDDINPFVTPERDKVLIPFFRFPKPDLPFRQEGGSDLESLVPIANARDRVLAGMLDSQSHNEQPILLFDRNRVVEDEVMEKGNLAGARFGVEGNTNGAMEHVVPPALSTAAKELANLLLIELNDEGHIGQGTMGQAVTQDASGELQREVRFDADRPWGATLRLHSYEWERFGQVLCDMATVCMEDERVLAIAGEDQALQFLTVRGELFQGAINIRVQPESMVLETRQDKQNRLIQMLNAAATLRGAAPDLADLLLSNLNYPNIQRVTQRGGAGYSLAQRQIAELVSQGTIPQFWPEQDHPVFVQLLTELMHSQAFGNLDPERQQLVRVFKQMHEMAGVEQGMQEVQKMASQQALAAGIQAQATLPMATAIADVQTQAQSAQQRMQMTDEANASRETVAA